MKLVNLKKLRDIIDEIAEDDEGREIVQVDSLLSRLSDCLVSPDKLAEILEGKAWVLEKLKKEIKVAEQHRYPRAASWTYFKALIEIFESQAPVSKLTATEVMLQEEMENSIKRAKADRRKARTWDKCYQTISETVNEKVKFPFMSKVHKSLQTYMDELLVKEEKSDE